MTHRQLLELIVPQLGFTLEATQFNRDSFIMRRPALNSSGLQTYYAYVWVKGGLLTIYGWDHSEPYRCDLANPDAIETARQFLAPLGVEWLNGSYKSADEAIGTRFFEDDHDHHVI
jgi:hypothetical protein